MKPWQLCQEQKGVSGNPSVANAHVSGIVMHSSIRVCIPLKSLEIRDTFTSRVTCLQLSRDVKNDGFARWKYPNNVAKASYVVIMHLWCTAFTDELGQLS